jgi:dynein heavy chain
MINATKTFIAVKLSEYYVQPPSLVYEKVYQQSSEKMPIVFILSPGADPLSDVAKMVMRRVSPDQSSSSFP